jgi:hypothetical protein
MFRAFPWQINYNRQKPYTTTKPTEQANNIKFGDTKSIVITLMFSTGKKIISLISALRKLKDR